MTLPVAQEVIDAFGGPYLTRRTVKLLDLDHNIVIDGMEKLFVSGQVNIDSTQAVSRSATVELYDPTFELHLDSATPGAAQVAARYLVALTKGIKADGWSEWVDIPVGVLWANRFTRNGDFLTIEAQGKEALLSYPFAQASAPLQSHTIPAGTAAVQAIADLLDIYGETRFRFDADPDLKVRSTIVVTTDTNAWSVIKTIATSIGWDVFYDAEGYAVARPRQDYLGFGAGVAYTFTGGDGGVLRAVGEVGNDASAMVNAVIMTGATPQGRSAPLTAIARVETDDAIDLVRNNLHLVLPQVVSNSALTTQAATQSAANSTLASTTSTGASSVSFTSSPVWHLEEGDPCYLDDPISGAHLAFIWGLGGSSIPLGVGDQTNGFMRKVHQRKLAAGIRSVA